MSSASLPRKTFPGFALTFFENAILVCYRRRRTVPHFTLISQQSYYGLWGCDTVTWWIRITLSGECSASTSGSKVLILVYQNTRRLTQKPVISMFSGVKTTTHD
jgi:hypothetical protein